MILPPRRVLRNTLNNYLKFESWCSQDGNYELKRGHIRINFSDLKKCLEGLPPRKMQALWLNVICDKSQHDVAREMGIAPGSVGQYVDHAMREVSLKLFPDLDQDTGEKLKSGGFAG